MKLIPKWHAAIFSDRNVKIFERLIIILALAGFLIHLGLIFAENYLGFNVFISKTNLTSNPISALYTPFTFILIYEAFLLIYYLPRSFTTSVAKEFEIISLVIIRKIFKDIPELNLDSDSIINEGNLLILYDLLGIIAIFYLIYLFKKTWHNTPKRESNKKLESFINYKKLISISLVPILFVLCFTNFYDWFVDVFVYKQFNDDLNGVFFIDFFTVLILVDVLILLISFQYTERYSQLMRNTGFIISTILLRLSFSVTGLFSIILLVLGVAFGLVILKIYKLAEESY
tara:strand:- start:925 stop:1785 length:861 start_codon:yes stop_codon:yes gene_type:complete